MANHFRTTERQGSDDTGRVLNVVPDANPQVSAADDAFAPAPVSTGQFDVIGADEPEAVHVVTCIQNYDWTGKNVDDEVEIITASVRTPNHVTQAALMGADIATVPFGALKKCLKHPLTDQGMASFDADWAKVVAAQ